LKRNSVLIVDDDKDIRENIQTLLEFESYDVLLAEDAKQALGILESSNPKQSLILLDLQMPRVTGEMLLERMQKEPQIAKIPVVVITASSRPRPRQALEMIMKPFDLEFLLSTIKKYCSN
jgi:CheY-like chemotaxis protein